ncbi:Tyrosine-protein phosphatase Lar, partial [Gryllus bimaculatus]
PSARPDPSLVEVQQLGSRGFTLRWHFPGNCSAANGALDGMHYAIRPAARPEGQGEDESEDEAGARGEAGFSGLVMGTRQRFRDLRPATEYAITLHLVSPAGWDPALGTTIFVTTLPEGAEEVRVHEATRDSVSLRWLPPEGSTFRSVAVTTLAAGGRNESAAAWSEPCPRWPAMRCLTLSRLQADTRYDIWVHISTLNNTEVQVHTVHLEAKTTEGSPSAPRELRAEALSATALRLRWRAPAVRGGVLRNFVLIVHHVRSHATGACCVRNRIEVVEVPPADADRQDLFEYEVTGLPPASTFGVSLSAVTASAGAAANTTAHTAPLLPLLPAPLAAASPLKLVAGPGACLRARLPPAAASEEWSPWGKPVNSNSTSPPAPATTPARALPEELLRVLPDDYTALHEAQEAEDGTVCVGGAAGGGQRAGLALLLQYATAASAAVWRSDAFDLLDCFHAPAPAPSPSPAASAGAFVCL